MSYISAQNMVDRFGDQEMIQLTDRDGLGVIDEAVLERAVNDASAELESYLGGRYQLPLSPVPRIIETYAADMARYRLYDDGAPEQVQQRYKDAVQFLIQAAAGKVTLGATPFGERASGQSGAQMQSGGRAWARDKSTGFL